MSLRLSQTGGSAVRSVSSSRPSRRLITDIRPLYYQEMIARENMEKILAAQPYYDKVFVKLHDTELYKAREYDYKLTHVYKVMRGYLAQAFEFNCLARQDYPLEVEAAVTEGYLKLCYNQLDEMAK